MFHGNYCLFILVNEHVTPDADDIFEIEIGGCFSAGFSTDIHALDSRITREDYSFETTSTNVSSPTKYRYAGIFSAVL